MRSCTRLKSCMCASEARRNRRNCTLCLATAMMNGADLLLNSTKAFMLPLGESYNAIHAADHIMMSKVALFVLLNADPDRPTELGVPRAPMFGMGVV